MQKGMKDRPTLIQSFKVNLGKQGQDCEQNFLLNLGLPYPQNEKIDQTD